MEPNSYDLLSSKLKTEYIFNYPNDAVTELEALTPTELLLLLKETPADKMQPALQKITADSLISVIELMDNRRINQFTKQLSAEQLYKIISGIDEAKKQLILQMLPKEAKRELEEISKYPPQTAGSIMDPGIITFTPDMTVTEAVNKIKIRKKRGIRAIYLSNEDGQLGNMISMQQLIMSDDDDLLGNISKPIPAFVTDLTPQEEIVEKLEEHNLTDIPVVDINNHLIGVVRHHTLIQVTKEELTKDMQKMVGVNVNERALSHVFYAVRKRLPWLEINLLTAFLAAAVVGLFENTIAQFTALAVLLPVVAGQSGNTGAQALAVTMRGLALKEIRTSHWLVLVFKEFRIAFITGIAVSLTTALGVYVWSRSAGLTFIIAISMILSMIIASVSGATVPLVLHRLGQDPASSSSIILTTITDVCGFFSFLGIATLLSSLL